MCDRQIRVYSAPHLSTPCCLAEPVATYALDGLPEAYRKAYEDAKRLVNQLKQRIPKVRSSPCASRLYQRLCSQLVLYKPDVKCTLMANEPLGDIELTFNSHVASPDLPSPSSEGAHPQMRVSLRRRRQAVEIARFVPSLRTGPTVGAGEWTRKVLPASVGCLCVSDEDLVALDPVERAGLERLAGFLSICETLEALERETGGPTPDTDPVDTAGIASQSSENGTGAKDMHYLRKDRLPLEDQAYVRSRAPSVEGAPSDSDEDGTLATVATTASTRALPSIELAPRPVKFSTSLSVRPRAASTSSRAPSGYYYSASSALSVPRSCTMPAMSSTGLSTRSKDEAGIVGTDKLETRFMPLVGWCTRCVSADSCSHKIMFQDGAILQVDSSGSTEEIWYAETPGDKLVRLSATSAERTIPKRIEAYAMFMELFGAV